MRSWSRWSRVSIGITAMAVLSVSVAACPSSVRTARSALRGTLAFALITEPKFTNGSFEAGLEGWTVQGHIGVSTSDPVRPAPDGTTVAVFNGDDETSFGASLTQTFATTAGRRYGLAFDFGTVGAVADQLLQVTVSGEGVVLDKMVRVAGLNDNPFYVPQRLSFIADAARTTLTFTEKSYTYVVIDGLLDNVRITEEIFDLPMVVSDPMSTAVAKGQAATFDVQASGPGTLGYQWQFNGHDIPGATGRELRVVAEPSQAGNYAVVVTNPKGSITSSAATLTILPPATLLNGSFEYGSAAWTFSGPYDWSASISTNPRYGVTDGSQLVHFNWGQHEPNGGVSQTIATVPGREYALSFDVGAFSMANRDEQRMRVTVRGTKDLLSHEVIVYAPGTGGRYRRQALTFVADSTATTLEFEDTSRKTTNVDLLLDNVSVIESQRATPQTPQSPRIVQPTSHKQ
jgi:Protein of unknown function (DUF642)